MIPFFQGAAGGAPVVSQVFATTLYTGNGSTQTVTTGINTSTPGGLAWIKGRDAAVAYDHALFDTQRGTTACLESNTTSAEATFSGVTAFGTTGFTLGNNAQSNQNTGTYVAWSFARAARFFDAFAYNGSDANAGNNYRISHNLGVTPGLVICKRRDATTGNAARDGWQVWHRSLSGFGGRLQLESTAAEAATPVLTNATSTYIEFDNSLAYAIESAINYVAYLFAHDTASDGIVQCGSYTGNGATGQTITLGWEPQFLLSKSTLNIAPWRLQDFARGFSTGSSNGVEIRPSESNAEFTGLNAPRPSATGFYVDNSTTGWNTLTEVYAYLAIRKP